MLLVEDDPLVTEAVRSAAAGGFRLYHASTLAEARGLLAARAYHAVLLDLTLPDGSGLDLARELRTCGNEVPILMLTARRAVEERLAGFEHGADDYLCKPFEVSELIARLTALLRRSETRVRSRLNYADVELDLLTLTAHRGEVSVTLSAREFELLAYFLRHPEEVLSRDRLLKEVWGGAGEEEGKVIKVYVNYLRNKLEIHGQPRIFHTVRGGGYMLSTREPEELG